jgi:hypothetical protein
MGIGSAIVGAVGGGISGIVQSFINRRTAEIDSAQNFRYSQRLAEDAYKRDVDMWNKQNAYNSPQAQMQRYQDAGLNPALMYGQGNSGNASNMPTYKPASYHISRPPVQLPDIGSMIQLYSDLNMKNAQIDNIRQNTALTEQRRQNEAIAGLIRDVDYQQKSFNLFSAKDLYDYQKQFKVLTNNKMANEIDLQLKKGAILDVDLLLKNADVDLKKQLFSLREKDKQIKSGQITSLGLKNDYQEWKNYLYKNGITDGDNIIWRQLFKALRDVPDEYLDPKNAVDALKDMSVSPKGKKVENLKRKSYLSKKTYKFKNK